MAMNADSLAATLEKSRQLLDAINARSLLARLEALDTPLRSPSLDGQGGASLTAATAKGDHPTHSDAVWDAAAQRNPAWTDPRRKERAPAEIAAVFRAIETVTRELARVHDIYEKVMTEGARTGPCTVCSRTFKRDLNEVLLCEGCANALRMAYQRSQERLAVSAAARAAGSVKDPVPAPFDPEVWRARARRKHELKAAKDVEYRRLRELRKRKAS